MIYFIIRRTFWAIFLFFVATIVTYLIFFAIPNDPSLLACGKAAFTATCRDNVRHYMHLDVPIYQQYWIFLWNLVRHGSLGQSFVQHVGVRYLINAQARVTASIVFGGAILWMAVALPVGIYSALHPRSLFDRGAMIFVLIGISAPAVWIGLILSYVFGYKLKLTPTSGYCPLFGGGAATLCSGPVQWAWHMILPWMTFMFLFTALYVRMMRASVMETMSEDYIRTARAKGAPERRVLIQHVLRNALLPVVTMLGMDIGLSLGGAVFTETVFNLHGLGQSLVNAANSNDLPLVAGITVFIVICVVIANFVVDVLYAVLDPRIRLA